MTTTLVMGAPTVTSDLIGRRVRVFFDRSVQDAIADKAPVRFEGVVHAVGTNASGLVMWVVQELASHPWHPLGELTQVDASRGILLLP